MSLIRTASRVAVASSVHGRVQRRQRGRWAAAEQWDSGGTPASSAPQPKAAPDGAAQDRIAQLKALGELRTSGVLSEAEFDAEKRRILQG